MNEGPLTLLANGWAIRHQTWKQLDPVEQNLRRASHGAALVLFTIAGAFWLYGWCGVLGYFPQLVADPGDAWPGAVFFGGLLAIGLVRFLIGVRRVRGLRDGLRASKAVVPFALGLAASIYLGRLYPWAGATGWAAVAAPAVFLIALWSAVTAAVRLFLLSIGGSNASAIVRRIERQRNAAMRAAKRH